MGFSKNVSAAVAPVAEATKVLAAATPKKEYTSDDRRVRGQVRMHALITGYKVAAALAPTLANTTASIKEELHVLAAEVAGKIEAYSFSED